MKIINCLAKKDRIYALLPTILSPYTTDILPSVTRFGENLHLLQYFTSLWQIFYGLFLIWQNVEPTLANLVNYWADFHCLKWPNIEK